MNPHIRLLALALAFAPAAYAADEVYRSVMPNGDIVYGESPAPGARSSKKVPPPPSGVVVVTEQGKARAGQITPQQGGTSVIPQKQRESPTPAVTGGGSTYGQGPGPLPRRDY